MSSRRNDSDCGPVAERLFTATDVVLLMGHFGGQEPADAFWEQATSDLRDIINVGKPLSYYTRESVADRVRWWLWLNTVGWVEPGPSIARRIQERWLP